MLTALLATTCSGCGIGGSARPDRVLAAEPKAARTAKEAELLPFFGDAPLSCYSSATNAYRVELDHSFSVASLDVPATLLLTLLEREDGEFEFVGKCHGRLSPFHAIVVERYLYDEDAAQLRQCLPVPCTYEPPRPPPGKGVSLLDGYAWEIRAISISGEETIVKGRSAYMDPDCRARFTRLLELSLRVGEAVLCEADVAYWRGTIETFLNHFR